MLRLSKAEWFKNDINVDYVIFLGQIRESNSNEISSRNEIKNEWALVMSDGQIKFMKYILSTKLYL